MLVLLLAVLGGIGYAMYRFKEPPRQLWERLVRYVEPLIRPGAEPRAPAPLPTPVIAEATPHAAPQPTATPRPDPLLWLAENRNYWPKEVSLRESVEFPVVIDGKVVGAANILAGTAVELAEIGKADVAVVYRGGARRVPITATDLASRAEVALAKAEADERQISQADAPVSGLPGEPAAIMEDGREATRDEIRASLGALYTREATVFRIFVPRAKAVTLVLYDEPTGGRGRVTHPLRPQQNDLWEVKVNGNLRGKCYAYRIEGTEADATREVIDPYAVSAVANSTRALVSDMPGSVRRGPRVESPTDMVIYEMHVRDFTISPTSGVKNAGLYPGFVEPGRRLPGDADIRTSLDHLVELGITHVQLMPIHDFENDEERRGYNWGYMPSGFFSPEGIFATKLDDDSRVRELKGLVDALHARGIGVILDVVYNHTSASAPFMSIARKDYYRHWPDGSLADGAACGNEFRSESPIGRKLIIDSLKFWTREYGFDGYRFDLMALIDQGTMRQAERELRAINPDIVLYGEPWLATSTPLRDGTDKQAMRKVEPIGAFNDDFRNALKGMPDGGEPGWIQNGSRAAALKSAMLVTDWFASPAQSINYMTAHDNLVLWDKLKASMPGASTTLLKETMKLGYLALFTSQGVPFIHGGEEFARTKGGHDNSFDAGDSVNQVDWALKREHLDLFQYVRDVIGVRKAHPLFRLRTREQVASRVQFTNTSDDNILMFTVRGDGLPGETWKRACVVLNSANDRDAEVTLPGGQWSVALDGGGAASARQISGKVAVRHKSGLVLYQR